jgi:STAM-binding protein
MSRLLPEQLESLKRKALVNFGADPFASDYELVSRLKEILKSYTIELKNGAFDQIYVFGVRFLALYEYLLQKKVISNILLWQQDYEKVSLTLEEIKKQSITVYSQHTSVKQLLPTTVKNQNVYIHEQETAPPQTNIAHPHLQTEKLKSESSYSVNFQPQIPTSLYHQRITPITTDTTLSRVIYSSAYPSFSEVKGTISSSTIPSSGNFSNSIPRHFSSSTGQSILSPGLSHSLATQSTSSFSTSTSYSDLRKMIVPISLISEFLNLSTLNSNNNIETCGILGAEMINGMFVITTLIIPKQKGDSDSTVMLNEEELVQFFGGYRKVIQAGWIHSHPTQGCFMSSIDIHTQLSYQMQLPEAVAIVVDPKLNRFSSFRLTDEGTVLKGRRGCNGIEALTHCYDRGFHAIHNGYETNTCYEISEEEQDSFTVQLPGVYHTCDSSKHVLIDSSLPIKVIDLR